jgi:ankyrin repeat protein
VEFQLTYVLSQGSPANIKATLGGNYLPKSLPDAYRKVMDQMDGGQRRFAFQIMSWIFHAARLLTIDELCEALSVVEDSEDLEVDLIPKPESIVKACESLVEIDKVSREVRFTHQTVDEFLRNYCASEMLSVVDLAKTCLIYLGFSGFERACRDGISLYKRCQKYKFSRYAANAWGVHTRGAGENNVDIRKRVFIAFKSADKEFSLHQIAEAEKLQEPSLFSDPPGRSFLHITALHGLATIGRMILDNNSEEVGRYFGIHVSLIVRLPQFVRNVNVATLDRFCNTPLHLAVFHGHTEVARLLVERDADLISIQNIHSELALHWAACKENEDIVELLIHKRVDLAQMKDGKGRTPVHWAVVNRNEGIVKLLIDKNPDAVVVQDREGNTALHLAIRDRNEGIAMLLIEKNANITSTQDGMGRTPLHWAVWSRNRGIVRLLVQRCAKTVSIKDKMGTTPLHGAVLQSHQDIDIVKSLVDTNPMALGVQDIVGRTPLHLDVLRQNESIAKMFVEKNVQVIWVQDKEGNTALHLAAQRRQESMVNWLASEERHDYIAIKNAKGKTAFDLASEGPNASMSQLTLKLLSASSSGKMMEE